MINFTLYKHEMKKSIKLLLILSAVITLYVTIIITMYDPQMMATLDGFVEMMPEIMAAVGMSAGATSLIGFMISYLYGFILLVFPMIYCILRAHGLIAKYVDNGSMVTLVAAPIKRYKIAITQICALLSGVIILIAYTTILEVIVSHLCFPGELILTELLQINGGLLFLHFFISGFCFLCSCLFQETKYSMGVGAGIPILMYVLQMLSHVGEKTEIIQYFSFFTLYNPNGILEQTLSSFVGILILLIGAILFLTLGTIIFSQRDLHI